MGRLHLVSISAEPAISQRLAEIAQEFEYKFARFESVDSYAEGVADTQVVMAVFSAISVKTSQEISGHIQVIKQITPETFVVVIADRKISPDAVEFIKKSGANLILLENSFLETSQLEFMCSQIIRGSLIPIKASELKIETEIDFPVMVMMPLNKKILPAASKGTTLSESRLKKLQEAKELYIKRDDLHKFHAYSEKHQDLSAQGLQARCRIQFLNLCRAHANLVTLLIDQGEAASFTQGKALVEDCEKLASDLLTNLASVEDPWSVVNNSSIGESGSAERSTSVAAMAGLIALQLDKVSENAVVVAGLLCDFGMLDLHPRILKKIRTMGLLSLNSEEALTYQQHPIQSVNKCLSRKLPLPENIKAIMAATHEGANGKGFPKHLSQDKIPIEAQVIHFAQLVDELSIVRMGETRRPIREIQKEIIDREFKQATTFNLDFLMKLRKALSV